MEPSFRVMRSRFTRCFITGRSIAQNAPLVKEKVKEKSKEKQAGPIFELFLREKYAFPIFKLFFKAETFHPYFSTVKQPPLIFELFAGPKKDPRSHPKRATPGAVPTKIIF